MLLLCYILKADPTKLNLGMFWPFGVAASTPEPCLWLWGLVALGVRAGCVAADFLVL